MSKRIARTLGLVLLGVASASMPSIAQQKPLTIHGRVFAADNRQALRHARVALVVDGEPGPTIYTDDRGEFSIAAPSAARFTLSVVKATFAVMQMPLQRATLVATTAREISIALNRAAAINGRVVDTSGEGVVGLRVYADRLDPDADTPPGLLKFATTTDDRGEYRLGALPPGRYAVTATNALDPGSVATLVLRPGDDLSEVDFRAQPPPNTALTPSPQPPETRQLATIRGRVLSSASRPIRQAVVNLSGPIPPRYALTDAQGRFMFPGLIPGDYEVSATSGDSLPGTLDQQTSFESTSRIAVSRAARVDGVTLVLSRGLAVTGTIVDRTGEPLQGVPMVALQLANRGDGRQAILPGALQGGSHQTDDRGRYRVFGLLPGQYVVEALADAASLGGDVRTPQPVPIYFPGSASIASAASVTLTAKDVDGVDFALTDVPMARVSGIALDSNGAPLKGTITLAVSHRSGFIVPTPRTTQPEADGAFTFVNVAPGEYVLQASRVEVRVQDVERGSNPINGVEFAAQYVSVSSEDAEPVRLRTARGALIDGRIATDSPRLRPPYERLQIEGRPVDFDFTPMQAGDVARGRVDGGRFRIPGLFGARRFVLSGMPAGWYLKSLTINGADMTDLPVDFGVGAASTVVAEIVISGNGGAIGGRVTGEKKPPDGSSVVVFPQDRRNWFEGSRFIKVVRPLRDGSFRAASLPPGNYYVATAPNPNPSTSADALARMLPRAAKVTLNEGNERIVEIPLP